MVRADPGPVGAEMEFLVGMAEAVEEMAALEAGPAIEPDAVLELVRRRQVAAPQGLLDDPPGAHLEAPMPSAEALRQVAQHIVVRAAFGVGRQHGAADLQEMMAAGGV